MSVFAVENTLGSVFAVKLQSGGLRRFYSFRIEGLVN